MSPQTFIFIGRSGCGKGTQVKLLDSLIKEKDPNSEIFYLETGMRFREFIKNDTYSSNIAKSIYESGERQPDFLAIWMWAHLLIESFKGTEHLVADGTPRSLSEAIAFITAMKFYNRQHINVVYINVSREWAMDRLKERGRFDDTDQTKVEKRLNWFDKDVAPAIEFFKNNPDINFYDVDGERPIQEIHLDIVSKLGW
ncbi:MAG: adenylate kinase [Parcubacteria bacterium C7867-003]|nr:MAG: adenylate kinase [Parcubacteria bacterium C7867-003]